MEVDKTFCMSSYLMYRYNYDVNKAFSKKPSNIVDITFPRIPVKSPEDLISAIEQSIENANKNGRLALALSGGIDSAILAKFTPKGTKAYTFRCIVKGKKVIDETERARHWADICGLEHTIIDITWEDITDAAQILMKHKGAPIHSIEAQIYIAAKKAGIEFVGPYSQTYFDAKIDYKRIRSGDTKYIIREAFKLLYPNEELPAKIPMPRPLDEWLREWKGPVRSEFWSHCTDNMTGDQKWMVWALEQYLNILDSE